MKKKLGRAPAVHSLEPLHSTTMSTHNTHASPQNLANRNNVLDRLANLRVDRQITNILMLQFLLITSIV